MSQAHDSSCRSSDCSNSGDGDDCRQQADKCKFQGKTVPECAVCLQQCIHPACLPCNHVFCYLCVKGVANQSKRCPMCRQEIPADFLEHPQLLELDQSQEVEVAPLVDDTEDESLLQEFQWFYEGRNGWWQYDQRTNIELETAYKQRKQTCELLIAGFLYIADFATMFQVRRNDHSRRRRIKRDLCNAPKKGIAGLRLNNPTACVLGSEQMSTPIVNSNDSNEENGRVNMSASTSNMENNTVSEERNSTAEHHETNSLHPVLEQMRSVVLRGNPSIDEQISQTSNVFGSVSDDFSLPWAHQMPSNNTINTSDEDQT